MSIKIKLILIFLSAISLFCISYSAEQSHYLLEGNDGPYLFYQDHVITSYSINERNQLLVHTATINDSFSVKVPNEFHDKFSFFLQDNLKLSQLEYPSVERIFAVSDIEGNFEAMVGLFQANGIINDELNWDFGDGHLVIVGDLVDRGTYVTPCLWLIYKLEQEAEEAGGQVHYLLGNHELMDLKGRIDYAQEKYIAAAQMISEIDDPEEAFRFLFSDRSVLGKWIRSKNTIEKIGDVIFVHAGLSPELLEAQLSIQQINDSMRTYLGLQNNEILTETGKLLVGRFGPVWFRGLVTDYKDYYTKTDTSKLDNILSYYKAGTVVIGHTIRDSIITTDYNGQVIKIDIHQPEERGTGKAEALLIEGNEFYRVNDLGERFLLNKEE